MVVVRDYFALGAFFRVTGSRPDADPFRLRNPLGRALDGMLETLGAGGCFIVSVALACGGATGRVRVGEACTHGQTERNTVDQPADGVADPGTARVRLRTER